MGQGQATQGIQGLNDVANTAVDAQIRNNTNKFNVSQGDQGMYGTIAGAAVAGTTNNLNKPTK